MNNFWKNKKVFITGHSGFKGSWLCSVLLQEGAVITGYSLRPPPEKNLFDLLKLEDKVKSHWADVRDYSPLRKCLSDASPDVVFHLAAQPLVKLGYQDPVGTFSTNAMGTVNLLEACRNLASIKTIINVTTDKVYFPGQSSLSKENDKLGGNDPYSASKACSEIITHSFQKSFYPIGSARVATARAGNVIGGGDWADARLVPDFIRALNSNKIQPIRNMKGVRPWQHVLDSIYGYMKLAEFLLKHPDCEHSAFNFAPREHDKNVADFTLSTQRQFPDLQVKFETIAGDFHEEESIRLDPELSATVINWKSRWNFDKTIFYAIDWYLKEMNGEDPWTITQSQIQEFKKS